MTQYRSGHMQILTLLFVVISYTTWAQPMKPENYHRFDERTFHFGFMLGGNVADFTMYQKQNVYEQFGITSIENEAKPGGQLGVVTTIKLGHPVLRLRIIPTLSFQERHINYQL